MLACRPITLELPYHDRTGALLAGPGRGDRSVHQNYRPVVGASTGTRQRQDRHHDHQALDQTRLLRAMGSRIGKRPRRPRGCRRTARSFTEGLRLAIERRADHGRRRTHGPATVCTDTSDGPPVTADGSGPRQTNSEGSGWTGWPPVRRQRCLVIVVGPAPRRAKKNRPTHSRRSRGVRGRRRSAGSPTERSGRSGATVGGGRVGEQAPAGPGWSAERAPYTASSTAREAGSAGNPATDVCTPARGHPWERLSCLNRSLNVRNSCRARREVGVASSVMVGRRSGRGERHVPGTAQREWGCGAAAR